MFASDYWKTQKKTNFNDQANRPTRDFDSLVKKRSGDSLSDNDTAEKTISVFDDTDQPLDDNLLDSPSPSSRVKRLKTDLHSPNDAASDTSDFELERWINSLKLEF